MKRQIFGKDTRIVIIVFIVSRIIAGWLGLHLDESPLFQYWQYLDVETLRHHLLRGVWYDHAQPPGFNLFLGIILKLSGAYSLPVFSILLKIITLVNALLLLDILKKLATGYIPLLLCLLYLISPAALLFECELFYTGFITLMLLISMRALVGFQHKQNAFHAAGIFLPLVVVCLTRSMYHLLWLLVLALVILAYYYRKKGWRPLFISAILSLLLVGGWYFKNYLIFGSFSASSWIGMNLSRNVFHDNEVGDSTRIEAYAPFLKVSEYRKFLSGDAEKKYAGLNDRDLLNEFKNDSIVNRNHIAYIELSKQYMAADLKHIRTHPFAYLQNVVQSAIIFFAPATRYSRVEAPSKKIKYYDAVYSFNLSQFANGKQQRRVALTISAIPKLLIYACTFFLLLRPAIKRGRTNIRTVFSSISLLNRAIIWIILFIFLVGSLLEHYENMRFRYEIEPLFLILLGQVLTMLVQNTRHLSDTEQMP